MKGRNSSLWGWWDTTTGYPKNLWMSHPWNCSRSGCTGLWETRSERCPYPQQGGLKQIIFKGPFQPKPFYDSWLYSNRGPHWSNVLPAPIGKILLLNAVVILIPAQKPLLLNWLLMPRTLGQPIEYINTLPRRSEWALPDCSKTWTRQQEFESHCLLLSVGMILYSFRDSLGSSLTTLKLYFTWNDEMLCWFYSFLMKASRISEGGRKNCHCICRSYLYKPYPSTKSNVSFSPGGPPPGF